MKTLLGFLVGAALAFVSLWWYNKPSPPPPPPPTPAQIAQEKKDDWNQTNSNNGRGISIWVDLKRDVVCYTLRDGYGTGAVGGISCLPRSQVSNLPY